MRDLLGKGLTPQDIAKLLNVTTQAVYKHKKALEAEQERRAS